MNANEQKLKHVKKRKKLSAKISKNTHTVIHKCIQSNT